MSLTRFQNTEGLARDVEVFSKKLEELRLAYEQYFLGLVREEPVKLREDVFSRVRSLTGSQIQNARLRFKLQQTIAKYNTYATLWDKTLREIEEGRYKRDLFRLRLHQKKPDAKPDSKKEETKKEESKKPDPFETLFRQFVAAKQSCKEPTEGLSAENFKKGLLAQVQKIQPQLKGAKVKFVVTTENGKATIKLQKV